MDTEVTLPIVDLDMENLGSEISYQILKLGFYPTASKGCVGIVFTHNIRLGSPAAGTIISGSSETARCRKLILGRGIWGKGL